MHLLLHQWLIHYRLMPVVKCAYCKLNVILFFLFCFYYFFTVRKHVRNIFPYTLKLLFDIITVIKRNNSLFKPISRMDSRHLQGSLSGNFDIWINRAGIQSYNQLNSHSFGLEHATYACRSPNSFYVLYNSRSI